MNHFTTRTGLVDYYAVLGVPRTATVEEMKQTYKKLALRWHPDRCASLPEMERLQAELIFKQANLAHEVLSNEELRAKYDRGEDVDDPSFAKMQEAQRQQREQTRSRYRAHPSSR